MIDLEAFEYKQEIPKEEGWYPMYHVFDGAKRKLIAEFDGKQVMFLRHAASAEHYFFGPKLAERAWSELDLQKHEVGLK